MEVCDQVEKQKLNITPQSTTQFSLKFSQFMVTLSTLKFKINVSKEFSFSKFSAVTCIYLRGPCTACWSAMCRNTQKIHPDGLCPMRGQAQVQNQDKHYALEREDAWTPIGLNCALSFSQTLLFNLK